MLDYLSGLVKLEACIIELRFFPKIFIWSLNISVPASLCWSCECIKIHTTFENNCMGIFHPCTGCVPGFSRNAGFETERRNSYISGKSFVLPQRIVLGETRNLQGYLSYQRAFLSFQILQKEKGVLLLLFLWRKKGTQKMQSKHPAFLYWR